jgi:hypothetical protein
LVCLQQLPFAPVSYVIFRGAVGKYLIPKIFGGIDCKSSNPVL